MESYGTLVERLNRIGDLDRTGELLAWYEETAMPAASAEEHGRQAGLVRRFAHELFVDDETGRLLDDAAAETSSLPHDSTPASVVRTVRRQFDVRRKASPEMMGRRRAYMSTAHSLWLQAREARDFAVFAPAVERWIELSLELADAVGYDRHPYDGLLDFFGTGPAITTDDLTSLFQRLREEQASLIRAIGERPQVDNSFLKGQFDVGKQDEFGRWVITQLGYDLSRGGISETVHPAIREPGRNDVRVMVAYHEDRLSGLWGTIHESGHAMYEQGVAPELPGGIWTCGVAAGNDDFHESQSRLYENQVGRSRAAWEFLYPKLQATFPEQLGEVPLPSFYRAINRVEPGLVRIRADEATYNLHVILRFEIENDLLEGRLAVKDAPEAWRVKMGELLGIVPTNDLEGILQDIHWTGGFGSFHFYTLGNVIAAQLWEAITAALPDLDERMAAGDFGPLRSWLREHVHQHGQKFDTQELLRRSTGQALSADAYLRYLRGKFGAIYGLSG